MSNKHTPKRDHWKELVKSLDLDIDLDETSLNGGSTSEVSGTSGEEMPDEAASPDVSAIPEPPEIPTKPVPTSPMSKVDPLFDLGWNSPDEDVMEENHQDDKDSESASDWMALAAQLGVPIRLETEPGQSDASVEESPAEEPAESESFQEVDEAYDPLAAWQSPAPAAEKPWGKNSKEKEGTFSWKETTSEKSCEVPDTSMPDKEKSIIIGKPKEKSGKFQKDRRSGRRQGRRRDRDVEVESAEIMEAEEVVPPRNLDQEPWELEEESSEEPKSKKRRRRSRRRRKSATAATEDREAVEIMDGAIDVEIFEEEVKKQKKTPKSHRGIPSWEEAIGLVIEKNLGKRNGRTSETKNARFRGGRGKSVRRNGGRSKE